MSSPLPFVSAICPTYNRRAFVPRAIAQFLEQDYAGERELVIVDDGTDPIEDLVPADERIRYIRPEGKRLRVGAKRNLACEAARGDFICHWDDDDWMRVDRLSYQMGELTRAGADLCGLEGVVYHDPITGEAFWTRPNEMGFLLRAAFDLGLKAVTFHDPDTGDEWDLPNEPRLHGRGWFVGATLCYAKKLWREHPFRPIKEDEDMLFLAETFGAPRVSLADDTFYVAGLHDQNTCTYGREGAPSVPGPPGPTGPETALRPGLRLLREKYEAEAKYEPPPEPASVRAARRPERLHYTVGQHVGRAEPLASPPDPERLAELRRWNLAHGLPDPEAVALEEFRERAGIVAEAVKVGA